MPIESDDAAKFRLHTTRSRIALRLRTASVERNGDWLMKRSYNTAETISL